MLKHESYILRAVGGREEVKLKTHAWYYLKHLPGLSIFGWNIPTTFLEAMKTSKDCLGYQLHLELLTFQILREENIGATVYFTWTSLVFLGHDSEQLISSSTHTGECFAKVAPLIMFFWIKALKMVTMQIIFYIYYFNNC